MKQGYIYIMSNKKHGTLYVGVTSNLIQRVYQHKHHLIEGFTKRYNLNKLVYFEQIEEISSAIEREKQLKSGSRQKKVQLIEQDNPEWNDLYDSIL